jgi:hypothetical protein
VGIFLATWATIRLSTNFRIVWPCIVIDSLWIKPTDALSSNFIIGISNLHVSGSLSAHHQEFLSHTTALVHFMQFGDRVLPGAGCYHPAPGSIRSPTCINCTNAVLRLRNFWRWAERLPETCRVIIPIIKLELSTSVGFIHKELGLMFDTKCTVWRSLLGSGAGSRGRRLFKTTYSSIIHPCINFLRIQGPDITDENLGITS